MGREIVGGRGNSLKLRPVITTGAYTAGDALGGRLDFSNAATMNGETDEDGLEGGTGVTLTIVLIDDGKENAEIDIFFFDREFVATADKDPFDPGEDDLENCLGTVTILATDYKDTVSHSVATVKNVGLHYKSNKDRKLFVQMVTRDTPDYDAVDDLTLRISVLQD